MAVATARQRRKLAYQRADGSVHTLTSDRLIETLSDLVANGGRMVSSPTNSGLRLSHYIFKLRIEYGFPIHMKKFDQPGGVGWYGRYALREKVKIIPSKTVKPTTAGTGSASNPKSKLASMGVSNALSI